MQQWPDKFPFVCAQSTLWSFVHALLKKLFSLSYDMIIARSHYNWWISHPSLHSLSLSLSLSLHSQKENWFLPYYCCWTQRVCCKPIKVRDEPFGCVDKLPHTWLGWAQCLLPSIEVTSKTIYWQGTLTPGKKHVIVSVVSIHNNNTTHETQHNTTQRWWWENIKVGWWLLSFYVR